MMTLQTLGEQVAKLPSDNLLSNVVYRLNKLVANCCEYNENISFGHLLNIIEVDIDYLEGINVTVSNYPTELIIECLRNEVDASIQEINHLQGWAKDCASPYFNA